MNRVELIKKIKERRKKLGISVENLARLSNVGSKTIMRFFAGDDVKLSTLEKLTLTLGLDLAGNEMENAKKLKEKRAQERAKYIISLVQDTSSLEMQGLKQESINNLIEQTKQEFLVGKYQKNLWTS